MVKSEKEGPFRQMEQRVDSDENIKTHDQFQETGINGTCKKTELYLVNNRIPAEVFIVES